MCWDYVFLGELKCRRTVDFDIGMLITFAEIFRWHFCNRTCRKISKKTWMPLSYAELASNYRVGLRWHVCCRCSISKPRPILDSSSKTTPACILHFSKNLKMSSFDHFWCFWRFWFHNRLLSDISSFSDFVCYVRNTRLCLQVFILFEELFVCTSFRLYLAVWSISIDTIFEQKYSSWAS